MTGFKLKQWAVGSVLMAMVGLGFMVAGCNTPAMGWHPVGKYFERTGKMKAPRSNPEAFVLPDGRVFFVGGGSWSQGTTELYDPLTRQFEWGPQLPYERTGFAAAMLPDGRVLVAGGNGCKQVKPPTESLNPLVILHGQECADETKPVEMSAELIDPVHNTVEQLPDLPFRLRGAKAYTVNSHLVLVAGATHIDKDRTSKSWKKHLLAFDVDKKQWRILAEFPETFTFGTLRIVNDSNVLVWGSTYETVQSYNKHFKFYYEDKKYTAHHYKFDLLSFKTNELPDNGFQSSPYWYDAMQDANGNRYIVDYALNGYCKINSKTFSPVSELCIDIPTEDSLLDGVWADNRFKLYIQPFKQKEDFSGVIPNSAFILDTMSMKLHFVGIPYHPRSEHAVIPLKDGTVLIAGGYPVGGNPHTTAAFLPEAELLKLNLFKKDLDQKN